MLMLNKYEREELIKFKKLYQGILKQKCRDIN